MYQIYCMKEIWLVNIVCKTSQRASLKKRAGLIHRTVLRECNIVNLPNNTKCSKSGTKEPSPITLLLCLPLKISVLKFRWSRSTPKKQPEGCFLINILRFKFCSWVQCIESFDGRQLLWSIVVIFGRGYRLQYMA